jgi:flagellin-like hook-associated protein FlgL
MTRINTNVSSLNAQKTLARSNVQLQEALTRLSTGLRINSGKDDPAGLIASEVLRSDIISVQRAVTNSQRANQMIATADSALGQVSSLLNDIRGLVSEAANYGAMSKDQIAANQLQIDSSLEAIDRIANITQFQGRRLLDGNLDFVTVGVDNTKLTDLLVDQANFGNQDEISVAVDIHAQATRGRLRYAFGAIAEDVVLEVGGKEGYEAFSFAAGSRIEDMAAAINLVSDSLGVYAEVESGATQGHITASSYGTNNDIVLQAKNAGEEAGNYRIKFEANRLGGALGVTYAAPTSKDPGTIVVDLQTEQWTKASVMVDDTSKQDNGLVFTANLEGTQFNGVKISMVGGGVKGSETVSYNHDTNTLTIQIASTSTTANEVIAALAGDPKVSKLFSASLTPDNDGTGSIDVANAAWSGPKTLAGGVNGGAVLSTANDVIAQIKETAGLKDAVAADLAVGSNGYGIVSAFDEYAFYGQAEANNRLQFLAPEGTPNIRFVSIPGRELGIDLATDPKVEDFSSATIQGTAANTSIVLSARIKGAEYDDVTIRYHDRGAATQDSVVWKPKDKVLDVYVQKGAATAQTVVNLINNDTYVNDYFRAENFGASTGGGTIANADYDTDLATTAGGIADEGTVIINLATDDDGLITTTAQDLIDFFDADGNKAVLQPLGISLSNAEGSDGSGLLAATATDLTFATSGTDMQDDKAETTLTAVNGTNALIKITAKEAGAEYGDVRVVFEDTATAVGAETVVYDPVAKTLTIGIKDGETKASHVVTAINNNTVVKELFTAAYGVDRAGVTGDGTGFVTDTDGGKLSPGVFDAGNQDGAAFLDNEDSANTGLSFLATDYGSEAFVSVKALNGGTFHVTNATGEMTDRSVGSDIDARVNGIRAVGRGLKAVVNTSALDLTFSVVSTVQAGDSLAFTIVGGGAQFQLGPDVVSNQQARLGIASVNTAKLGGVSGRLFELRSGGLKSLDADVLGAARVVEEVITQVTTLRGRLGAFQRTTLETNINALNDTLESLTEAESSIRDADFASESARLTRAQILVQSGVSVLGIANSSPQNVLSLLQGR